MLSSLVDSNQTIRKYTCYLDRQRINNIMITKEELILFLECLPPMTSQGGAKETLQHKWN